MNNRDIFITWGITRLLEALHQELWTKIRQILCYTAPCLLPPLECSSFRTSGAASCLRFMTQVLTPVLLQKVLVLYH